MSKKISTFVLKYLKMKSFTLTKQQLLEQYNKSVDEILDECDWKTHITGKEVCGIVYGILSKNDIDLPKPIEEFYDLYSQKCSELSQSDEHWRENFGVNEIIDIVYDLLITQ